MRSAWTGTLLIALAVGACGMGPVESRSPSPASSRPATSTIEPSPSPLAAKPSPTLPPTQSPTPSPSATPIGVVRIPFAGREMEVSIVGEPNVLAAWRAATDRELSAATWGDADIALAGLGDRKLVLGWIGTVCDVKATLAVSQVRLVVSPVPREGCDLVGVPRGVVLTFAKPVDPATIAVVLEPRVLLPEGG